MAVGINNFQTLYQTFYPKKDLPWLIPKNLPLLNLLPKDGNVSGDLIDHPLLYGPRQGYSNDFNVAATQAGTAPRAARIGLRVGQAYSFMEVFDKDLKLSQGEAAYADLFEKTMTGSQQDFLKNLDLDLHVAGNGWRGTVLAVAGQANPNTGATLATNQIALARGIALETVFEIDQLVQAAVYSGFPSSGSIFPPSDGRAYTTLSAPVQVTGVDPNAMVLTLSDASAFVANSFITHAGGALGFSTSNLEGGFVGLDAWNPYGGVATTDSFLGINRFGFSTRLGGYSLDGSKYSIEEGIKRLGARMAQGGFVAGDSVTLMNPMDWDSLDSKLATYARYSSFDTATFGFESIKIGGQSIVQDPHMPQGFARILTPSTWKLYHVDGLPHVVDVEGRTMEQGLNFDGRTARLRAYAQLACFEPHKQGIIKLPQVLAG